MQKQAAICLTIRYHYEPLHSQVERLSKQACHEVSLSASTASTIANIGHRAKPKSLFAQTSSKKLDPLSMFGEKAVDAAEEKVDGQ